MRCSGPESAWAAPKKKDGSFDRDTALTGDDLIEYVADNLFAYLKGFRTRAEGPNTLEYKIGEIFSEIESKSRSGYRCAMRSNSSTSSSAASRKRTSCRIFTRRSSATWAMQGAV